MPTLSGITRDQSGAAVGGVTVNAFDADTDSLVASGISDAQGNYSLAVSGAGPFYVVGHKPGATYLAGTTRRDLTAVADSAATVQSLWTGVPTTDGAILTAKLAGGASNLRVAVSTSEALSNPTYSNMPAPHSTYRHSKATITGKNANTEYWYAIEVDGVLDLSTKGRFKTLPPAGSPANFTIALGGCTDNTNDATFAAVNALPTKPLFLMWMGDFQYMDITSPTMQNYHDAFDVSLAYGARKVTHSQIPTVYMWDDHDNSNNDATGRDLNNVVKSYRATSLDFFRSFIPAKTASATLTDTAHYSFIVGRVRFVVSDLRSDKTGLTASDTASKTMMGAAQKAWWKAEITAAKAAGQIVAWMSSVPYVDAVAGGTDQWGSYNTERVELADHIKAQGMQGCVFILSSDMHALAYHTGIDYATGGGASIPVLHAGPFNRVASVKGGPYTAIYPSSGTAALTQYGLLNIADDGTVITISFSGYSSTGTQRVSYSFTATPGAVAPATAPARMSAPTAMAGDGQVTLTLTAPSNGGSPVKFYTIPSLPAGAVDQQAGTASLTRIITGLANGVSRTFTATATNDVGTSPVSDPSNPVTPMAAPAANAFEATGGTITTPGDGYKYWTFLASDTLNVTAAGDVEYLVVAGGGGGGRGSTSGVGGGAAGGVRNGSGLRLTVGAHAITVGLGGVGSDASSVNNGADSSIAALMVATGGGGGGFSSTSPGNGGSGGGAGSASTATAVGTGIAGQGNSGGTAAASSTQASRAGGGGGGAGSAGGAGASGAGGNGGEGVTVWGRLLAGGGGGAAQSSSGTQGVGKAGGTDATRGTTVPANAAANTGSGGGAHITTVTGSGAGKGGDGGSGIVIIRRPV